MEKIRCRMSIDWILSEIDIVVSNASPADSIQLNRLKVVVRECYTRE